MVIVMVVLTIIAYGSQIIWVGGEVEMLKSCFLLQNESEKVVNNLRVVKNWTLTDTYKKKPRQKTIFCKNFFGEGCRCNLTQVSDIPILTGAGIMHI